jgi:hypothetical protein
MGTKILCRLLCTWANWNLDQGQTLSCELFTAMNINISVLGSVMPYSLVQRYQYFVGTFCLHYWVVYGLVEICHSFGETCWLFFRICWRWWQQVFPELCCLYFRLYDVTSQKTIILECGRFTVWEHKAFKVVINRGHGWKQQRLGMWRQASLANLKRNCAPHPPVGAADYRRIKVSALTCPGLLPRYVKQMCVCLHL